MWIIGFVVLQQSYTIILLSSQGPRTVVHPKARIIAEAGPIVIGEGNLIEEQALIINGSVESSRYFQHVLSPSPDTDSVLSRRYPENITPETEVEPKTMTIGMNNVFEVGCGILSEMSDHIWIWLHMSCIVYFDRHIIQSISGIA